jgi:SSS family solute:Na+ symporter
LPLAVALEFVVLNAIVALAQGAHVDASAGPQGLDERLRQRAARVLRTALDTDARWIKVHAAEALLSLDRPQGVMQAFERELALKGAEPEYRIGIWRVLARAAPSDGERERWTRKIAAAFLDANGPDRLHAAETLAKLGYQPRGEEAEAFELAARTGPGPLAANARWVLANSGLPDAEAGLVELLDSDDGGTRADAAYAVRHLPKLSPAGWEKLTAALRRAPDDDIARASLVSAAFVHAPADRKAYFRNELLTYARTGTSDQRYEACAALAIGGTDDELPLLAGLLDSSDSDVRVGAAHAILRIDQPARRVLK